jgi:hypothetical protein
MRKRILKLDMLIAKFLLKLGRHPHFSTSIAEETTAGFGQLDEYGFFQYPLSNHWINSVLKFKKDEGQMP